MSKQVLREFFELCEGGFCQDLLTEEEKIMVKEGGLFLTGIMQKCDQENGNGRVYSRTILEREVENYQKTISDRRALGELDHPDDSVINLKNVSHMVTKMWMEGSDGYGKLKILPTPMGQLVKTMLESGVKLGVSSRGSGNVSDNGSGEVSDFEIITVDVVAQPSAPGAYPTPIYEHLMNSRGGYSALRIAQEVKGDPKAQKYLKESLLGIISKLR